MGAMKDVYKILAIKLNGRDHLRDLSIDKRIILKCFLNKQGVSVWTGFQRFSICFAGVGFCQHVNDRFAFLKSGKVLTS
jgi:hypothetical protein